MAELISIKADIDVSGIADKFAELCKESQLRLQCHQALALACDPYVPFLNGPLSQTVEITPEYIQYIQPYAHYQYHGVGFNHTLDWHPLASAEWDEAMLRDKRAEFEEEIKALYVKRYRELYGR